MQRTLFCYPALCFTINKYLAFSTPLPGHVKDEATELVDSLREVIPDIIG